MRCRCACPRAACRTELLEHPVSQRRFAAVAYVMDLLSSFPLPGGSYLLARGAGASDSRDPLRDCVAVLRLHKLGAVLLPALVSLAVTGDGLAPTQPGRGWDTGRG